MTINSKKFLSTINSQVEMWSSVHEFFEEVGQMEGVQRACKDAQAVLNGLKSEHADAEADLAAIDVRINEQAALIEKREDAIKARLVSASSEAAAMIVSAKAQAAAFIAEAERQRLSIQDVAAQKVREIGAMNKELQESQAKLDTIRAEISRITRVAKV
jgi:DNA repair exonuclease SbcCD ATPase subunit